MKRVTKDNYLPLSISIVACLSSSAAATFTFDECKEAKKLGILLDPKDVQNNGDVTVTQQGTKKLDRARG